VLGGEERDMTILFSDVRGFTAISEVYKDDPQGLTSLMNRLLTPLTNTIIDHDGTVDKYIGDAVMAFWNAPLDVAHHEHVSASASIPDDALSAISDPICALTIRCSAIRSTSLHAWRVRPNITASRLSSDRELGKRPWKNLLFSNLI
jgi:class 3 adenylate cyclase